MWNGKQSDVGRMGRAKGGRSKRWKEEVARRVGRAANAARARESEYLTRRRVK